MKRRIAPYRPQDTRTKILAPSLIVFLLFSSAAMFAQSSPKTKPGNSSSVEMIMNYCAGVEAFEKSHDHDGRLFTNIGTEENSTDKWREVSDKKGLDKLEYDDSALVWFRNGILVEANVTFSSGSGDWANYAHYCFRADHTLARMHSILNTFEGHVRLIRDTLYDSNGTQIRSTSQFFDLDTEKPIQGTPDFMDAPASVFLKTTDLPFFNLLQQKKH